MEAIYGKYGAKADFGISHHEYLLAKGVNKGATQLLMEVIQHFHSLEICGVILGCTELALVLDKQLIKIPVVDAMQVTAKHVVSA